MTNKQLNKAYSKTMTEIATANNTINDKMSAVINLKKTYNKLFKWKKI